MVYEELTEDKKLIYSKLCMEVSTDISLDKVILSKENKAKLEEFIEETKNKQKYIQAGLKPINRLLLHGASGTGKTFLAKAIAGYFDIKMLYIDISKALASGRAPQSLTEVFNLAEDLGSALIFLDECDAICWDRNDTNGNATADMKVANNTLFQLLDQMSPSCIFIGATNLYNRLDVAFVRRFNIDMKFLAPKINDLSDAISRLKGDAYTLERNMDSTLKRIVDCHARGYSRFSYAQIEDWVQRAEKTAIRGGSFVIKESEIYKYLMRELRIEVKIDDSGEYYLHQYGIDKR